MGRVTGALDTVGGVSLRIDTWLFGIAAVGLFAYALYFTVKPPPKAKPLPLSPKVAWVVCGVSLVVALVSRALARAPGRVGRYARVGAGVGLLF